MNITTFLSNGNIKKYESKKCVIESELGTVPLKPKENSISGSDWIILKLNKKTKILFINAMSIQVGNNIKIYSTSHFENTSENKALYSWKKYKNIKYKCKYYTKRSKLGITAQDMIDWNNYKKELVIQNFYKSI